MTESLRAKVGAQLAKKKEAAEGAPPKIRNVLGATTHLDHMCDLDIEGIPAYNLSSIICTIGPSSREVGTLIKMIEAGMNIARLNLSYGTQELNEQIIINLRKSVNEYSERIGVNVPIGIALDTKGPEIRTGILEGGIAAEVELKKGETIKVTTDKVYADRSTSQVVYVDYENITKVISPGNTVFIDDGSISLNVKSVGANNLVCLVETGGVLGSCKGVNLPGVAIDLPGVSDKDKVDLRFGVKMEVDMIFASFVRNADAIKEIRDILGEKGKKILVIAKIENHQGIENLQAIIAAADGIVIARGDLGIEIPAQKVFLAQKAIISQCNRVGKPVICATQMLESMMKKPKPTRGEGSDVACAIIEGADCIMLSGETAKGEYPIEAVKAVVNICKEAETAIWHKQLFHELESKALPPIDAAHTIAIAAVEASTKCIAGAMIVLTTSGRSAYLIAKYRPHCPIIAVTRNAMVARQCHLHRGLLPLEYNAPSMADWMRDVDTRVQYGLTYGQKKGFIKGGDPVIIVTGWRAGSGFTNTIRIVYVSPLT